MVKRAGGSLLLSAAIDPRSERPVSTQLYMKLREMILAAARANVSTKGISPRTSAACVGSTPSVTTP